MVCYTKLIVYKKISNPVSVALSATACPRDDRFAPIVFECLQ